MINQVNWFEIAVSDMPRAKKFYEAVFATTLIDLEVAGQQMAMFPGESGGVNASGALVKADDYVPSTTGTKVYFTCKDVNHEADLIAKNGGQVVVPKMDLGEFGYMVLFIDTEGNMVGLHSMN
ncbi:MAG: hypothetical protein RL660_2275 [Bacteroidota bacterium]